VDEEDGFAATFFGIEEVGPVDVGERHGGAPGGMARIVLARCEERATAYAEEPRR
jgi:hypothetical protein